MSCTSSLPGPVHTRIYSKPAMFESLGVGLFAPARRPKPAQRRLLCALSDLNQHPAEGAILFIRLHVGLILRILWDPSPASPTHPTEMLSVNERDARILPMHRRRALALILFHQFSALALSAWAARGLDAPNFELAPNQLRVLWFLVCWSSLA